MAILQELKELYANRDLKKVRSLVDAYFADDCVVFGTCVGEMSKSKQDVFDLIDSDLRYWYDLDILLDTQKEEKIGAYSFLSVSAVLSYTIHENEKTLQQLS